MAKSINGSILLTLSFVFIAGCATAPPPVSVFYSPSGEVRGGAGSLFLSAAAKHPARNSVDQRVRFVIGKQMDTDGMTTGEILSVNSEEDMMLDAMRRELTAAGYSVESGTPMPQGVTKGVDLTAIQVELDETASIPKIEASGTVKVSMNVWKNGVVVKKLSYESKVSDTSIINRDKLPRDIIEKGLRGILSQAVPDIISIFEHKSTE